MKPKHLFVGYMYGWLSEKLRSAFQRAWSVAGTCASLLPVARTNWNVTQNPRPRLPITWSKSELSSENNICLGKNPTLLRKTNSLLVWHPPVVSRNKLLHCDRLPANVQKKQLYDYGNWVNTVFGCDAQQWLRVTAHELFLKS